MQGYSEKKHAERYTKLKKKGGDNMYLVTDTDLCIYFQGTEEECKEFLKNPVSEEIFEKGNITAHIESIEQYNAKFN